MEENPYRSASRAKKLLDAVASLRGGGPASKIDAASRKSPDPDAALLAFLRLLETLADFPGSERILGRLQDEEVLDAVATIAGGSDYLASMIIKEPGFIDALFDSGYLNRPKPFETMVEELKSAFASVSGRDDALKALRKYRQGEILRITARDLMEWGDIVDLMAEISDLASASAECAFRFSQGELADAWGQPYEEGEDGSRRPAQFAIMGMGKLGGRELNYSSDIDLVYLYGADTGGFETKEGQAPPAGKTLADFWAKVAENTTALIGEVTEDGLVFRVDLRLRPRGNSGPVANTLEAAVEYYLTWGQTWERAALLKARPVAGDIELGNEFLAQLEPWLHRRYLDFGLIEEIQEMKIRIDAESRRAGRSAWNVKLGSGGIREIEFFVQSIQLVHGGKIASIRRRNTLESLSRLAEAGLVSAEDSKDLSEAYRFMRKLEHRIQFEEFQQTQSLPRGPEIRDRLAATMGFRGPYDRRWAQFEERLDEYRADVSERYRGLFVKPVEETRQAPEGKAVQLARNELSREEAIEWLARHGFADPDAACTSLQRLREGPRRMSYRSDSTQARWRDIAPLLIQEVADAPDPDMALVNLERFLAGVGARATTLALLRQHSQTAKFLVNLFGTSEYLSNLFISKPELLDDLVGPRRTVPPFELEPMWMEMAQRLSEAGDLEERMDALRLFVHERTLQIGLDDLAGEIDHRIVGTRLSNLAEAALRGAYEVSRIEIEGRYGEPMFVQDGAEVRGGLAVIGMGKLGGAELSYGSDLDVIFVFHPGVAEKPGGVTSHEYFIKMAQRIISAVTIETSRGHCYSLDTRLRPSGRAGSLVSSLEGFEKYHKESSAAWERQALIRIRPVAGDLSLGKMALEAVYPFVYEKEFTEGDIEEIRRIRNRMAEERSESAPGKMDLKLEPGGLTDAEFTVQVMQLKHGRDNPALRTHSTSAALDALKGIMPEEDRRTLEEGWDFLRRLSLRLRITRAPDTPILETEGRRTGIVARALGYRNSDNPAQQLLDDVHKHMGRIRELYGKYV